MEQARIPLVMLSRLGSAVEARLVAARLAADGIEARVRSEANGPYAFTVGRMAEAEIWVGEHQLEEARAVMLEVEVADAIGAAESEAEDLPGWSWQSRLLAAAVVLIILGLIVRRFLLLVSLG